jgi:hypothetical protein
VDGQGHALACRPLLPGTPISFFCTNNFCFPFPKQFVDQFKSINSLLIGTVFRHYTLEFSLGCSQGKAVFI